MKSTLDEVPALLQLTALFALGVAIAKWLVRAGNTGSSRLLKRAWSVLSASTLMTVLVGLPLVLISVRRGARGS